MKLGYGTVTNDKECFEFCLDMPGTADNCKMRPSYVAGEFGDSSSWHGMYRYQPFREATLFEYWRGNFATGVRGIIDPFDPDNPYGPKSASDMVGIKKQRGSGGSASKNLSGVSLNKTAATLNDHDISKISNVSQLDMTYVGDLEEGCLYQRGNAGEMGSVLLSSSLSEIH